MWLHFFFCFLFCFSWRALYLKFFVTLDKNIFQRNLSKGINVCLGSLLSCWTISVFPQSQFSWSRFPTRVLLLLCCILSGLHRSCQIQKKNPPQSTLLDAQEINMIKKIPSTVAHCPQHNTNTRIHTGDGGFVVAVCEMIDPGLVYNDDFIKVIRPSPSWL